MVENNKKKPQNACMIIRVNNLYCLCVIAKSTIDIPKHSGIIAYIALISKSEAHDRPNKKFLVKFNFLF